MSNDHTSNRKLNSLAVLSMHSERVNELEWNNRSIKVFIELTECGNVDTEVQNYQLLSRSQARFLFLSASTALLSCTIFHQAFNQSIVYYRNRNRNRKLLISRAPTKAKSQEPAYSQALNQNKIDRQRSRSGESGRQTVRRLWWMVFGVETGREVRGRRQIRIGLAKEQCFQFGVKEPRSDFKGRGLSELVGWLGLISQAYCFLAFV